jgi:hypothetical protein
MPETETGMTEAYEWHDGLGRLQGGAEVLERLGNSVAQSSPDPNLIVRGGHSSRQR